MTGSVSVTKAVGAHMAKAVFVPEDRKERQCLGHGGSGSTGHAGGVLPVSSSLAALFSIFAPCPARILSMPVAAAASLRGPDPATPQGTAVSRRAGAWVAVVRGLAATNPR